MGKTTTAMNLSTGVPPAMGWKVLLIDLDPQGNASTGLGVGQSGRKLSSYDVLIGSVGVVESVVSTRVAGWSCIAGDESRCSSGRRSRAGQSEGPRAAA